MITTGRTYLSVNDALPDLAQHVLNGPELGSRLGERVLEQLHQNITLKEPWRRYLLVPGRKANVAAQIAETMWVLAGRDDVDWLANYLPRAKDFSDDGETWRGAYGPRLRAFAPEGSSTYGLDQLHHVLQLLREDPTTRRAVIQIYDPRVDAAPGKDVPCNNWITFQSRLGKLHMHVAIRSNDLFWGWSGINAFEWSALQEILAGMLGIGIGQITFSISSLHAYDRHWKRLRGLADNRVPLEMAPGNDRHDAPGFADNGDVAGKDIRWLDRELRNWFAAEEDIRRAVDFRTAQRVVEKYDGNPMFSGWLAALAIWWHGADPGILGSVTLAQALFLSPKRKRPAPPELKAALDPRAMEQAQRDHLQLESWVGYVDSVVQLHQTKHAAYGDSWKRRGEQLGILANVARKADRLGATDEYETALDTAVDLLVYLAKYLIWLEDRRDGTARSDGHQVVDTMLRTRLLDTTAWGRGVSTQEVQRALSLTLDRTLLSSVWTDYSLQGKISMVNQLVSKAAQLVLGTWADGRQR